MRLQVQVQTELFGRPYLCPIKSHRRLCPQERLDENNGVGESKSRASMGDGRRLLQRAGFSVGGLNGLVLLKLGCSRVFMNKKFWGSFKKKSA